MTRIRRPPRRHPRPLRRARRPVYQRRAPRRPAFNWLWVLLALAVLAASGIGGWWLVRRGGTRDLTPTALPTDTLRPTLNTQQPTGQSVNPPGNVPDLAALQRLMLDLVNADRATERLSPVQWDAFAAQVGQTHAEDMAANGYMSHWNLAGEGPDVRYGRAGGMDNVQENVYLYWYRHDDGSPAPIEDWEVVMREAEATLMDSPGHRANIMAPEHTHVGIGIAYNAATGDVRIAQEFLNRYVALEPLPSQARVGDTLTVRGQLLPGASNPLINLAYEPFPQPMTVPEVEARSTYQSPAKFFSAVQSQADANGRFLAQVTLDADGQAGVYHVLIWVDVDDSSLQAVNVVLDVAN